MIRVGVSLKDLGETKGGTSILPRKRFPGFGLDTFQHRQARFGHLHDGVPLLLLVEDRSSEQVCHERARRARQALLHDFGRLLDGRYRSWRGSSSLFVVRIRALLRRDLPGEESMAKHLCNLGEPGSAQESQRRRREAQARDSDYSLGKVTGKDLEGVPAFHGPMVRFRIRVNVGPFDLDLPSHRLGHADDAHVAGETLRFVSILILRCLIGRNVLAGLLAACLSAGEIDDGRIVRGRQGGKRRSKVCQESPFRIPSQTFVAAGIGILQHLAPQSG